MIFVGLPTTSSCSKFFPVVWSNHVAAAFPRLCCPSRETRDRRYTATHSTRPLRAVSLRAARTASPASARRGNRKCKRVDAAVASSSVAVAEITWRPRTVLEFAIKRPETRPREPTLEPRLSFCRRLIGYGKYLTETVSSTFFSTSFHPLPRGKLCVGSRNLPVRPSPRIPQSKTRPRNGPGCLRNITKWKY